MRRSDEFQPADLKGISMIPFGLLAGFMDEKEIRITELAEEGFRFRLSEKAVRPKSFYVCFYDMERSTYEKICLQDYKLIEIADENGKPGQPENEITENSWVSQGQKMPGNTVPIYSMGSVGTGKMPGNTVPHKKTPRTIQQIYPLETGR